MSIEKKKTLYLTEKDSQKNDLAKVLNCIVEKKWHPAFSKDKSIVIAPLMGHLMELYPLPQDYDESFKAWNRDTEFCFPQEFKKRPKRQTIEQLNRTIALIKEYDEIILASDFDNEGANLALTVVKAADCLHKVTRMLEMGSTTETALKRTLENPIDIPFKEMSDAGDARAYIDWVEGMSYSRTLTTELAKNRSTLMFGGVKAPVLRFIVEREISFLNHEKIKFYTVSGFMKNDGKNFSVSVFRKINGKKERKFDNKRDADDALKAIEGKNFELSSFSRRNKAQGPEQIYDLSSISSEMSKKINLSADDSMNTAQILYNDKKIQTYPRTAIRYLKDDDYDICGTYLKNLKQVMHTSIIEQILENPLMRRKTLFNSSKVTSHGGLTPTDETKLASIYSGLGRAEKLMFDLVSARFIANFMDDYIYEAANGEFDLGNGLFCNFNENRPVTGGWKEIYESDIQSKIDSFVSILPDLKKGTICEANSFSITEGESKPKPRFNMSTLQEAMAKIANLYPDDDILKEQLGENGIGTPATIPGILKDLFSNTNAKKEEIEPWLLMKGKSVVPSKRAMDLIKVTPSDISSPIKRAELFKEIKRIERGEITLDEFLDNYRVIVQNNIDIIRKLGENPDNVIAPTSDKESLGTCPVCKKGDIIEGKNTFLCTMSSWKTVETIEKDASGKDAKVTSYVNEGCKYSIFKRSLQKRGKKEITVTDVKKLLSTGEVSVTLKDDQNKSYKTVMEVNEQYGLGFKKKKVGVSLGTCPLCNTGTIHEKDSSYGCSAAKWKKEGKDFTNSGCTYSIRKKSFAKLGKDNISPAEVKEFLQNGEIEFSFVSKSGTNYDKFIIMDPKWGLKWKD